MGIRLIHTVPKSMDAMLTRIASRHKSDSRPRPSAHVRDVRTVSGKWISGLRSLAKAPLVRCAGIDVVE